MIDKYEALARDAATAGDRVAMHNYLQHAEHYIRVAAEQNTGRARDDQYD